MLPENKKIFKCFTLCDTQYQSDAHGINALKWDVVIEVARAMNIKIDGLFFSKLRAFESVLFNGGKKTP